MGEAVLLVGAEARVDQRLERRDSTGDSGLEGAAEDNGLSFKSRGRAPARKETKKPVLLVWLSLTSALPVERALCRLDWAGLPPVTPGAGPIRAPLTKDVALQSQVCRR